MADAIRPPLLRLGTALSLQCWAPSRDLTFSLGGLDRLCAARREFKVHVRHQERVLRRQTGARGKVYRGAQISSRTRVPHWCLGAQVLPAEARGEDHAQAGAGACTRASYLIERGGHGIAQLHTASNNALQAWNLIGLDRVVSLVANLLHLLAADLGVLGRVLIHVHWLLEFLHRRHPLQSHETPQRQNPAAPSFYQEYLCGALPDRPPPFPR